MSVCSAATPRNIRARRSCSARSGTTEMRALLRRAGEALFKFLGLDRRGADQPLPA